MAADPNNAGRAREIIPRENYRLFTSIPTAAIALDGVQYVHYMYWQVGTDFDPLNYSSIYRSLDNGATWESCRDRIEFDENSNFGMVGYATREGGSLLLHDGNAYRPVPECIPGPVPVR